MTQTEDIAERSLRIEWHRAIAQVDRYQWNRLCRNLPTPFLEWEWLNELERSGSITVSQGWQPAHLTLTNEHNQLVAGAPFYIKTHSRGEFVFDQIWAQAAHQLDIPYYPKLVGMSPVTPVSGYRFLMDPAYDASRLTQRMLTSIDAYCQKQGLNSVHLLFVDQEWLTAGLMENYLVWQHQGFLLENNSWGGFDDFLSKFRANQRNNIKKERRSMARQGISFQVFSGNQIPVDYFDRMYRFYANTNDQFGQWSCKYLTPSFFKGLANSFRHRLVLVAAFTSKNTAMPIGMALFLKKGPSLWGRYWGAESYIKNLHFNTCYYKPTQWLIDQGLRYFDPGLGGYHKVRRGFKAVPTFSLHRFFNPLMARLFAGNIHRFNRAAAQEIEALNETAPLLNLPN